jgi:hypothetical protein
MKTAWTVGFAVAAMTGAGWSVSSLDSVVHPPQPPPGLEAQETHASASLLGQFRTSMSAWLWVRTDLYLHNGVEMRPMTDAERKAGIESSSPVDDGHEQLEDESSVATVVPPKERDFRGIFGDVQRLTDTYKDMHRHTHNDPKLALPLFRLMTWIDPQFIPGWTTGAMVMARGKDRAAQLQAIDYLREGFKENPQSIGILADLGHLEASHLHDPAKATEYLELARTIGAPHFRELSDDDQVALQQSYRWLGICYRDLSEPTLRSAVLREGMRLFPDDTVLLSMYCPPPTVLTKKGGLRWFQTLAQQVQADGEPELK